MFSPVSRTIICGIFFRMCYSIYNAQIYLPLLCVLYKTHVFVTSYRAGTMGPTLGALVYNRENTYFETTATAPHFLHTDEVAAYPAAALL